jgi:hypothetical protein
MNHLFQVTVYTGQQLVLEGLQRWLHRPCVEPEAQRQRRSGIKSIIVLLLKTAATGVLATVLDAAIEYRRRQLLAAASDAPAAPQGTLASLVSLGPLSRAGIAAWKARLLVGIDEMERQAEQYGIEPTRRFAPAVPAKDGADSPAAAAAAGAKGKAPAAAAGAAPDGAIPAGQVQPLSATMEQLRVLAGKPDDADAARRLDEGVDFLVDALLGGGGKPADGAAAAPCVLSTSASRGNVSGLWGAAGGGDPGAADPAAPPAAVCQICMDREVRVQVLGCAHDLCFQCARRLCATHDHAVPQCPFCRQTISGFQAPGAAARP